MNQMSKRQKVDVAAQWRAIRKKFGKRQHRAACFFEPHFIARGVGPYGLDDATLRAIVAGLPDEVAKAFFKQPDARTRYAANTLVRALVEIEHSAHLGLPRLTEIPALDAEARANKKAFEARFADDLAGFFLDYRLPDVHKTEATRAKLAAKGQAAISTANKNKITNGLFNAFKIVSVAIGAPDRLVELCDASARPAITQAVNAHASARAVEMLGALSQLAQAHEDYASAKAFNQSAVGVNAKTDASVISAQLRLDLQPFADPSVFSRFGAALVAQAKFAQASDLKIKTTLIRVGSALAALAAVSVPATFAIVADCAFDGEPDPQRPRRRPTLFSKQYGNLEAQLGDKARELIDAFFFGFVEAFGSAPRSLLAGKDGELRPWAQQSVNKQLGKIGAPFTGQDLRDLGVYRMAWQGDSNETMATAARLNLRYFKAYFKPMLDDILERKGPRHDGR